MSGEGGTSAASTGNDAKRASGDDGSVRHQDDFVESLPDKPSADAVRALSRISPLRGLAAIATEWLLIFTAIALCRRFWHPLLYVLCVAFIGARQHALLVIGHDAAHFTLLPWP